MRILVADDHPSVRSDLVAMLTSDPTMDIVGEASDGQMAVELADKLLPDLVIIDICMPQLGGIEATRQIVSEHPNIRVIGFSVCAKGRLGEAMKDAGAVACIGKDEPIETLIDAIHVWSPTKQ